MAEAVQAVRACLSKLAPENRLYITYLDIHGLTQRAACELLGWRVAGSTAHKRHLRIRARLRHCLEEKNILIIHLTPARKFRECVLPVSVHEPI